MKLWKRAAGALKDQNSILLATILTSRNTSSRTGSLEAAIIKATSHDGGKIDYKSAQRVFEWIRKSPVSLKPLVWGLSLRMERTHSWVVAIKGLMLMHGILCCKTPLVLRIGRLPFDLSNFSDGHSSPAKMWGFNAFVRSYYTFLDQRTALLYPSANKRSKNKTSTEAATTEEDEVEMKRLKLSQELSKLQKWQELLDLLLQIKPLADNMKRNPLILEAMDCVTIEIFDLYSNICRGITRALMEVHWAGKAQSAAALQVLQKARTQGKNLALYFEFCRAFDVFSAMAGVPKVAQIVPEEDIKLEEMVAKRKGCADQDDDFKDSPLSSDPDDDSTTTVSSGRLQTVITDKWEVFDEDHNRDYCYDYYRHEAANYNYNGGGQYRQLVAMCDVGLSPSSSNPFEDDHQMQVDDLLSFLPATPNVHRQPIVYKQEEVPDLISF
ncbi:Putative clathrin assembly protein At1g25240 [Linum grandiflorum]